MRILFMGNNWVGLQVLRYLKEHKENIVGLVVHPSSTQRYGEDIIKEAGLEPSHIFVGSTLRNPAVIERIRSLDPEIGLSMNFGYILKNDFLNLFPKGVINLHPAFLPFNRGQYPNVWSIIEGTPAGVTLHYVDAGIDTGDIIAQKEVPVEPVDTGITLYEKLEQAAVELVQGTWPLIKKEKSPRIVQTMEAGSFHKTADVNKIDHIDLDQTYIAQDLINILRARTFPPYKGAYFIEKGRRVFMSLYLEYEQDEKNSRD